MAENRSDNTQLEEKAAAFAQDRSQEKYAAVMELLEKSVVLVPTMMPQGLDEETKRRMKEGRPVQLPKDAKILPCLLQKDTGEQALPIFSSASQIPQDKKSPAVMTMPFEACLSMVMASGGRVETMLLNPFTHNMVIPRAILDVAVKRRDAAKKPKTIQMTEKQFQALVHNRVALQLLPGHLFAHKEEGLKQLQQEAGAFLVQFYKDSYPEGKRSAVPVSQEDFSVMPLNITEDMQLTRVDMPDETMKRGMCYRVYAVFMNRTKQLYYYTFEKTEQGDYIGQVTSDGRHELVEPVPDNGAEIEAVMELVTR